MPALLSLLNFPLFTIMNLELWRLFTTPLLHLSKDTHLGFLQLLFSLLSVIPTTNEIEKS
jgi:membrane associated rhomboid family serine protease